MNLMETELCLGLPGGGGSGCEAETLKVTGKRGYAETVDLMLNLQPNDQSSSSTNLNDMKLQNSKNNKDLIKPPAKYDSFLIIILIRYIHIYRYIYLCVCVCHF